MAGSSSNRFEKRDFVRIWRPPIVSAPTDKQSDNATGQLDPI